MIKITDLSPAMQASLLAKMGTSAKKSRSKKKTKSEKTESAGEQLMALHLRDENIAFVTEFKFCDSRRWRSDFHLTGTKILIEVEGGTWTGGRHTRGKGYQDDCEKYSWAAANGWIVLRYTTGQIKNGLALENIKTALKGVMA